MKASNDKQKILIMAVLGVALLGVGAFQFMGKGPEPAKTSEKKEAKVEDVNAGTEGANSTNQQLNHLEQLVQRDPFDPKNSGPESADPAINSGTDIVPPTPPGPELPKPGPVVTGPKVGPMNPMDGQLDPTGVPPLPDINHQASNFNGGGASNEPPRPSMRLSGVVVGHRPMAVLTDENGKQKLVKVGDELNGKKIVAIQRDKVVLASNDPKDKETLTWKRDVGN